MQKKILLNCLPPVTIYYPNPALSILKSFLTTHNYSVEIKYWNFLLNSLISGKEDENITDYDSKLMIFYSMLADQYEDKDALDKIIAWFCGERPEYLKYPFSYEKDLELLKKKAYKIINDELNKINFNDILLFGVSCNLLQLVPGIILAGIIKEKYPRVKIVAGGIGNQASAFEIMNMCLDFDFAIWGEGEYPLLELAEQLSSKEIYNNVPRLVLRNADKIECSKIAKSKYLDFNNYIFPDYWDYEQVKNQTKNKRRRYYPINSTRSCYWKKCRFCNYYSGHKYRERDALCIVKEIDTVVRQYKENSFMFVDNDIIGSNIRRFEKLLDLLIAYRKESENNVNLWCEMIPHTGLNDSVMNKMSKAGFASVFVGFEAVTDRLLEKMCKSNDFALNLLVVKSALKNNIEIKVNIIKSIPDETREDVIESMKNLHFLRFCFNTKPELVINQGYFGLYKESGYYSSLSVQEIELYNTNAYQYYISELLIGKKSNLFAYIRDVIPHLYEWYAFSKRLDWYIKNKFSYQFQQEGKAFLFREFFNGNNIKTINMEDDFIDILRLTNDSVITLDKLHSDLLSSHPDMSRKDLIKKLNELKSAYLLYCNTDYSRIISIVEV